MFQKLMIVQISFVYCVICISSYTESQVSFSQFLYWDAYGKAAPKSQCHVLKWLLNEVVYVHASMCV